MDLSLVIPCYNEAPHLRASVAALREVLDATRWDYEIVFVDDCSQDGTRALLTEICATTPRCRSIFHETNTGRGGAFKTGFRATSGRVTGFIDVDLEVGAHYIVPLVTLIDRHGADLATGFRHYLLRQTLAIHRVILSYVYRMLLDRMTGWGVRDSETGCKFFRRDTATGVVLGSESDGWFWDTEVMARAVLAGLSVRELPVLFLRRWDKQSTVRLGRDIVRYLVELHRFRKKVGLALSAKSPIYWTRPGYELVMRALYGAGHARLYEEVAALVPDGASVVDLCCGTARLFREHLASRGCRYLGVDFNGHFVVQGRRRGVPIRFGNVLTDPIPPAEYVLMTSSLYHFRRDVGALLERMKASATRAVIVSEPVRNVSAHPSAVGRFAAWLSNPGIGDEYGGRFDLEELRALAASHGATTFVHRAGERNAIVVFPGRAGSRAAA